MHFRLTLDLPHLCHAPIGPNSELSAILQDFGGTLARHMDITGPVYDLRGRVCGYYIIVNRPEVNPEA